MTVKNKLMKDLESLHSEMNQKIMIMLKDDTTLIA